MSHLSVSGNVEVCIGGLFYSICDEGWGQEEAQVACNALNYPSRDYGKFIQCIMHGGRYTCLYCMSHSQVPAILLCMHEESELGKN